MKRSVWFGALGLILCNPLTGLAGVSWSQATEAVYVGSAACLGCHSGTVAKDMRGWQNTLHAKLYRDPKPENIIADFTGSVKLSDASRSIPEVTFTLNSNGGKGPFTISFLDSTFTVMRAHGGAAIDKNEDAALPGISGRSKYIGKQRFQTKIGNSWYVLPVQWNPVPGLDGKGKGWVVYNIYNWVDTAGKFKLNKAAPEDRNCAGCHQTGVKPSVNAQGEWVAEATEPNIACESCHGPGSEHTKVAMSKPADMKIANPAKLSPERANEVCGQCHDRGKSTGKIGGNDLEYAYSSATGRTYRPGDSLKDYYTSAGGTWPDGTSRQHHQQWIDAQQSDHYKNGRLTCSACHTSHGEGAEHNLKKTARDNSLCVQCHGAYADVAAVRRHTKHQTIDPMKGLGRCVDCHMPAVQSSGAPYDIHSHTFKVVSPQLTADMKNMPNACAVSCHRGGQFGAPTFGIVDASLTKWDEPTDVNLAIRLMQAPGTTNAPAVTIGVPLGEIKATKLRSIRSGQVVSVNIMGEAIKGAIGFRAIFTYDPAKLKFGSYTTGPAIPGLTGLAIRDDLKGTVELGGTSLDGAAMADLGMLGTARFEVLQAFSGSTEIIMKSVSVIRPDGRKDSDVASAITLADDSSPSPITMDLDPSDAKVTEIRDARVGQMVQVEIFGEDIQNAMGFRAVIGYDPVQLRFGGFLSGPAIPGLSGVNIRDDSKGALEVGGVSLEGASILPKGKLGVLRFEVLTGFTGVADVTLKGASIIRATGRKDSDAAFKVSITKSGSGPAAPPPSGGLTPKAGNGTGMLDLNTAAGDQKSQTKYSVKAGDKIDVQVLYGKESANAGGFQVVLGFDPAKIKVAAYKKDGTAFADAMALPAQTKGDSVTYGASILGGTTTAKGALAILTFETLPGFSGDTEITLKSIMIRISGVGNTVVPGASVVISSGTGGAPGKPTPDFSGDGEVGFDDFFEFAAAFGQPATGANAKFDLDGDGEIGFGDFFEFAAAFGTKVGAGKTVSALPGVNALANVSLATAPSAEGFTVRLAASDVAQMRGYTAVLSFDPSALAFVKAERAEDALLTRAGSTPLFLAQETSPGRVVLADAAIGGTASGEGALANLVFRRIGADGASSVRVDLARIFDGAGGANTLAATDRDLPPAYLLAQNYPNPFNPETRIAFGLPEDGQVRLTVYNMMGQMVRTLVNGPQPAGNHAVRWDGRDDAGRRVASGIYLYRLQANGFESVRRMMLVK